MRYNQMKMRIIILKSLKEISCNHILSNVIVTNNNYDTDIWGGISNLKITCQNNSTVSLDQITVNVKYIKRNGCKSLRGKNILFNNVPPSQSQTIQAPNSERGLLVEK